MVKPRTVFKACRACRRKRARCDGQEPCQRCKRWKTECLYDQRPGETKEKLRNERAVLQSHDRAVRAIIDALISGENDETALVSLWHKVPIENIADKLLRRRSSAGAVDDLNSHKEQLDRSYLRISDNALLFDHPSNPPSASSIDHFDFASSRLSGGQLPAPCNQVQTSSPEDALDDDWENQFGLRRKSEGACGSDEISEGSMCCSSQHSPVLAKIDRTCPEGSYFPAKGADARWAAETLGAKLPGATDNTWDGSGLMVLPYQLVKEFVHIFFSRQYIPFPVINQDLFMQDFHAGRRRYCSSALLRSICCLACRVSGGYDNSSPHAALGTRLFDEATRLLKSIDESEYNIPDAQALGLLSLHQLGLGEYAGARELADESVRRIDIQYRQWGEEPQEDSAFQTTRATTLFGAISLARMVRLTIVYLPNLALLPQTALFSVNLASNCPREIDPHVEQLLSGPELIQVSRLPTGVPHVPSILFQLTGWVYGFSSRAQISDGGYLPNHLRDTYRACLSWYDSALQSMGDQHGSGPFVHLFYHFCLLTLFRPFCHLPCLDAEVSPAAICAESAEAILALAQLCNDLGERHLPCFVPLFVCAAGLTESDIRAGSATMTGDHTPGRQRSPASDTPRGSGLLNGSSLAERAREQLFALGNVYPAALKCKLELQNELSSQHRSRGIQIDHQRAS